jgi:uncharacterized protein (DUF1800 family)
MLHTLIADHYLIVAFVSHPNAAPFVSMQLIQHIGGISNPSPAYVNRVANAFTNGESYLQVCGY